MRVIIDAKAAAVTAKSHVFHAGQAGQCRVDAHGRRLYTSLRRSQRRAADAMKSGIDAVARVI